MSFDQSNPSSPDRDWVPKNRPQSQIARNFSAALDDIFNLSGKFDDVEKEVEQKQQNLTSHNAELEALEARLRAAEERLKQAGAPVPKKEISKPDPIPESQDDAENQEDDDEAQSQTLPLKPTREPPTVPNPAPGREYVMVDRPASKGIEA